MFEFKIDNAHAAYKLMQEGWPTKIVSLIGPDINFTLPVQGPHHIMRMFHDFEGPVDPATLAGTTWDLKGHDVILPTKDDIFDVLQHCWDLKEGDRLLIHCHAGRSRSAAMLIGIIFDHMRGDSIDDARRALKMVEKVRPTMIPNRLMIEMMDEIMCNSENQLQVVVKEYWDSYVGADKDLRTQYSGWKA